MFVVRLFFSCEHRQNTMANAASETVEISVVCMLRRLSTEDPDKMLFLPKEVGDVPLSTPVRDVAAELFTQAVDSGRDIAPAQTLYVLIDGRVVAPASQHISMQELGVVDGTNLHITTPYLLRSINEFSSFDPPSGQNRRRPRRSLAWRWTC